MQAAPQPPPLHLAMTTTEATEYRFDRYEVRPAQRLVLRDGQPVALGGRAFDLLLTLIEERDRLLSQDELFARVWPDLVVDESNLRQHVSSIRKLLGSATVVTVAGRGYRFGAQLISADARSPSHSLPSSAGLPGLAGSPGMQASQADHPTPLAQIAPVLVRRVDRRPANKPTLIGREDDLQAVLGLLSETHLLSLVGSGGVGKTRMALEVSDKLEAQFEHGICYVELAPVSNPALVTTTVASALSIHEEPNRALLDTLLDYLRQRSVLLILDNCEHLIDSCALLAEQVLNCSAGTRILATSREALKVFGEVAWRLPSLRTAPTAATLSCEDLVGFAANRLFLARVQAVCPTFVLTEQNVAAVALICQQLDGIPLAIELAAARVGSIPLEQLASGLQDRFALLTNSRRTTLLRHQTLRSLIDWSHDLLSASERTLLRRLSQFAGGWTLDAAQDVCSAYPIERDDVLELLTLLVDKSLVVLDAQATPARYHVLESVRQYGAEKLVQANELEAVRRRFLDYFMALAETMQPMFTKSDQLVWLARANAELDNMRLAMLWAVELGEPELGLRLFNALFSYWYRSMHWKEKTEQQVLLSNAFIGGNRPPSQHIARSFYLSAMLAANYDMQLGCGLFDRCFEVSHQLGFDEGIAWTLMWRAHFDSPKRDPATKLLFDDSAEHAQRIIDPWQRALVSAQIRLAYARYFGFLGRYEDAINMVKTCEAEVAKIGGDPLFLGKGRSILGVIATRLLQFEEANRLLTEGFQHFVAVESPMDCAVNLEFQGVLLLARKDPFAALERFRKSLRILLNNTQSPSVKRLLAQVLIACAAAHQWRSAARLLGVLSAASSSPTELTIAPGEFLGTFSHPDPQGVYKDSIDAIMTALGETCVLKEVASGRSMTREEAVNFALVCVG